MDISEEKIEERGQEDREKHPVSKDVEVSNYKEVKELAMDR